MRTEWAEVLNATPGVFTSSRQLGANLRFWYIHQATGSLTVKVKLADGSSYTTTRNAGFRAGESAAFESFQVASDVASDSIEIWFSDTMEWELPPLGPGGGMPIEIAGGGALSVQQSLGRSLDGGYNDIPATTASNPGIGSATFLDVRRVTVSLDPAAPGPVLVGGQGTTSTSSAGVWIVPGGNFTFIAGSQVSATTVTYSCYNPNPVSVRLYALVEGIQ